MIGVLCVDDHPALRAGLLAVLGREPGLVRRGAVASAGEARVAAKAEVDVVLADYRLPDYDGLRLCRELKAAPAPPRVLIYSAHVEGLAIPAHLSGADGVLDKATPAAELMNAIRVVARGGTHFPDLLAELAQATPETLEPDDLPLLAMLADGATRREVAGVMRLEPATVERRVVRLVEALKPEGTSPW